MKSIARKLTLLIMLMIISTSLSTAEAKTVSIVVTGRSDNGIESEVVADMKRNAVRKALGLIIADSADNSSLFQEIMSHYAAVSSNVTIKQRRTKGRTLMAVGTVEVDADRLKAMVNERISQHQDDHADATACFLIRIVGAEPANMNDSYGIVLQTFNETFEKMGFQVMRGDEVTPEILKNASGESYNAYCNRMKNAALYSTDGITFAIIGEIVIEKVSETVAGTVWQGTARMIALDFIAEDQPTIFRIDDEDYKIKATGNERDDGSAFILKKTAANTSRAIAEQTLRYWKTQH